MKQKLCDPLVVFTVQPHDSAVRIPEKGETIKINGKPYILDAMIPRRPRKGKAGWPTVTFVCHKQKMQKLTRGGTPSRPTAGSEAP